MAAGRHARAAWRGRLALALVRSAARLILEGFAGVTEHLLGIAAERLGPLPPWVSDSEAEEAEELEWNLWIDAQAGEAINEMTTPPRNRGE